MYLFNLTKTKLSPYLKNECIREENIEKVSSVLDAVWVLQREEQRWEPVLLELTEETMSEPQAGLSTTNPVLAEAGRAVGDLGGSNQIQSRGVRVIFQ